MKKINNFIVVIAVMLAVVLLLTSCLPSTPQAVIDKMEKAGYELQKRSNIGIYTELYFHNDGDYLEIRVYKDADEASDYYQQVRTDMKNIAASDKNFKYGINKKVVYSGSTKAVETFTKVI